MPNDGAFFSPEFADAHSHARSGDAKSPTTPGKLAPSNRTNIDPSYLLQHENHFDPNVYTPEQLIQKGILQNKQPLQTA